MVRQWTKFQKKKPLAIFNINRTTQMCPLQVCSASFNHFRAKMHVHKPINKCEVFCTWKHVVTVAKVLNPQSFALSPDELLLRGTTISVSFLKPKTTNNIRYSKEKANSKRDLVIPVKNQLGGQSLLLFSL